MALPDLGSVVAPVQQQIRARYEAVRSAENDGTLSAGDRARLYGDLGHVLLAATFFDEAILCYRRAEALQPNDATWPYLRGHASVRQGNREVAATAFERTASLVPTYVPALVWLGEMQLDLGRNDLARSTFARAVAAQSTSAAALFAAGRAALALSAYADAVQHLERALAADPRATAIHYPLAMAYRGAGQKDRAEQLLRRRGNVAPAMPDPMLEAATVILDSAVSHEAVGMQALRNQDWHGAIAAFKRGLGVAPDDPSLRYWMASAMIASGDSAGAEHEFRDVIRRQPDYAKAHFSLGAVLDRKGQRTEALREYEAAVRFAPNMPEARLRLADTLRVSGQFARALTQYEAATKLDPGVAEAWLGGTASLIALGRTNEARRWIEQGGVLHPDRKEWADLLARIR